MAREIALRISIPVIAVWFGLVMGALNGGPSWPMAIAIASFVTLMLVASAAGAVLRGCRRYTRA